MYGHVDPTVLLMPPTAHCSTCDTCDEPTMPLAHPTPQPSVSTRSCQVLQRGLAATLRASTAPHAGTGTNSTGNTSSASSASADFMPHASSADDLPHDLFHRLAQEMGRILSVRAQAQAASQSTSSSSSCEGGSSGRVPRGRGAQQRRMTVPPAAHVAMLWAAQRVVQAAGAVLVKAATLDGDGGVVGGE